MKSNPMQQVNALTELATTILRAVKDSGLSAPRRTYRKRKGKKRARKATATTTATPKPRPAKTKRSRTATKPNPLADVA